MTRNDSIAMLVIVEPETDLSHYEHREIVVTIEERVEHGHEAARGPRLRRMCFAVNRQHLNDRGS